MKKLLGSLSLSTPLYLLSSAQVFAQDTINPCDNPTGNNVLEAGCAIEGQSLGSIIGFVVTIAFIIAVLIALGFLIWGGIKWITSGGDKSGVEAARNQIIAAIIGLIIVFLAFFILNLILGLFGLSVFNLELPTLPGVNNS